jgi:hypothetical protein
MNTDEILENITSRDTHKVWLACCEIIELGQEPEAIVPLTSHLSEILSATNNLDMGGKFYPNKRYVDLALRTINFHACQFGCPCALYVGQNSDPKNEEIKGYVKIIESVCSGNSWADFYRIYCNRCGQKFIVRQDEYHFPSWHWKYFVPEKSVKKESEETLCQHEEKTSDYRFNKEKSIFLIPLVTTFLVALLHSSIFGEFLQEIDLYRKFTSFWVFINILTVFYVGFKMTRFFWSFIFYSFLSCSIYFLLLFF